MVKPQLTLWMNLFAITLLVLATWWNWLWVWALYFLYLALLSLFQKQSFVLSTIYQSQTPTLYWMATIFWFSISLGYWIWILAS